jgi:hypothetical protein
MRQAIRIGDQDKMGATTRPRPFRPDSANHAPCRDTTGRSFHANRRSVLASGSAAVDEHPAAAVNFEVLFEQVYDLQCAADIAVPQVGVAAAALRKYTVRALETLR